MSIFLGDELTELVESIVSGSDYTDPQKRTMRIGVDVIPAIPKDTTDRNRTSPLAFTGNKFEFRMPGSSQSVAGPNIALNTIMAEELRKFADVLEAADDFDTALHTLVRDAFTNHKRIIFSGNGYSTEWAEEAQRRGLSNLSNAATALPAYISQKNIDLVTRHGIYSETEFRARYSIHLESYKKLVAIEARTALDMAQRQILPAAVRYTNVLTDAVIAKRELGVRSRAESGLISKLAAATDGLYDVIEKLRHDLENIPEGPEASALYYHDVILSDMADLRREADTLEELTEKSYWPFPTYSDLLFY